MIKDKPIENLIEDLKHLFGELKGLEANREVEKLNLYPSNKEYIFKEGESCAYYEASMMVYQLILSYLEDEEEDTPDTL